MSVVDNFRTQLRNLSYSQLKELNTHIGSLMSTHKLDLLPDEHAILYRLTEELDAATGRVQFETKANLSVWVRYNHSRHLYEIGDVELYDSEETMERLESCVSMKLMLAQAEITLTKLCKYATELGIKYNATARDVLMRWTDVRLTDREIEARL